MMKQRNAVLSWLCVLGFTTSATMAVAADPTVIRGRVFTAFVDPQMAIGAIVDLDTNQMLYVTEAISVLPPRQLDRTCIYAFTVVRDESVRYQAVKLVPPLSEVTCGHYFPDDRGQ